MTLTQRIREVDPTFWDRVEGYRYADIDEEFMGFTDIYEHLAQIIPKGRVIVDLGCAYAPQAIYFMEHKGYIGVDISECPKPNTPNSVYYQMTIKDWIETKLPDFNRDELFAICSYVPPWHDDNEAIVRDYFRHLFVFYPRHGDT